jgi:hypothetical protein
MSVDDVAFARGARTAVTSKQEVEKAWEPQFIAEIASGKAPRVRPGADSALGRSATVADLLNTIESATWMSNRSRVDRRSSIRDAGRSRQHHDHPALHERTGELGCRINAVGARAARRAHRDDR